MRVRIILCMEDLVVHGERFDSVTIDCVEDLTREQVRDFSTSWITSRNFLTRRMNGLSEVGESSLTIEPAEEAVI